MFKATFFQVFKTITNPWSFETEPKNCNCKIFPKSVCQKRNKHTKSLTKLVGGVVAGGFSSNCSLSLHSSAAQISRRLLRTTPAPAFPRSTFALFVATPKKSILCQPTKARGESSAALWTYRSEARCGKRSWIMQRDSLIFADNFGILAATCQWSFCSRRPIFMYKT